MGAFGSSTVPQMLNIAKISEYAYVGILHTDFIEKTSEDEARCILWGNSSEDAFAPGAPCS
jgi:hypothetical protein